MKKRKIMSVAICALIGLVPVLAEDKPASLEGRILGELPNKAALAISDDGVVSIRFVGADNETVPVGERVVSLIALAEAGRQEIPLSLVESILVADVSLPKPEGYTMVVQIRADAEAKPKNYRVKYLMYICGGCSRAEYGCTCDDH